MQEDLHSMANEGSGAGDVFDVRKVRRLVELMNEHDLAEVDLRQGDQRIRLRRGHEPVLAYSSPPAAMPHPAAGSFGSDLPRRPVARAARTPTPPTLPAPWSARST